MKLGQLARWATETFRNFRSKRESVDNLLRDVDEAFKRQDWPLSIQLARAALAHPSIEDDPELIAHLNEVIGLSLFAEGEPGSLLEAVPHLSNAAEFHRSIGNNVAYATALRDLGALWASDAMPGSSERFLTALNLLAESLSILSPTDNLMAKAIAHNDIASLCHHLAAEFPDRHSTCAIYHRLQACWLQVAAQDGAEIPPSYAGRLLADCEACGWPEEARIFTLLIIRSAENAVATADVFARQFPDIAKTIAPLYETLRPAIVLPNLGHERRALFDVVVALSGKPPQPCGGPVTANAMQSEMSRALSPAFEQLLEKLGMATPSREQRIPIEKINQFERALEKPEARKALATFRFLRLASSSLQELKELLETQTIWLSDAVAYQLDELCAIESGVGEIDSELLRLRSLLYRARVDVALKRPIFCDIDDTARDLPPPQTREDFIAYDRAIVAQTSPTTCPSAWLMATMDLAMRLIGGSGLQRVEELEESILSFEKVIDFLDGLELRRDSAKVRIDLGIALRNRLKGDPGQNVEAALVRISEAEHVLTADRYPSDWIAVNRVYAECLLDRRHGDRADDVGEARRRLDASLEILDRSLYPLTWSRIATSLAIACVAEPRARLDRMGDTAISLLHEALQVLPADEQHLRAAVHDQLAFVHTQLFRRGVQIENNRHAAIAHSLALLSHAEQNRDPAAAAEANVSLGILLAIDEPERALAHLLTARDLFKDWNKVRWASVMMLIAEAYWSEFPESSDATQRIDEAARSALSVFTIDAFPAEYAQAHCLMGDRRFALGEWQAALDEYACAVAATRNLFEAGVWQEGRLAQTKNSAGPFQKMAYCLAKLGDPVGAILKIEEAKARLVIEEIIVGQISDPDADELRRRIISLETLMTRASQKGVGTLWLDLERTLRDTRIEYGRALKRIRESNPKIRNVNFDREQIPLILPKNGALVVPIISSIGSIVIILRQENSSYTSSVHEIPGFNETRLRLLLADDDATASDWISAYTARGDSSDQRPSWQKAVENILSVIRTDFVARIDMALHDLPAGTPIIFTRHPLLAAFPIHAAEATVDGESKDALLVRFQVSFTPSLAILRECKKRIDRRRHELSIAVLANPTGDLPIAEIEGAVIADFFGDHATVLDKEITVDQLAIAVKKTSYLHLATHAQYDWQNPNDSKLLLANNSVFTARQISSAVDLAFARLVTLSGCETGMTDMVLAPDEALGLPASFLQSGCAGVIAAHWRIPEFPTMVLMVEFYKHHILRAETPAEALRQAQLFVRSASKHQLSAWCEALTSNGNLSADTRENITRTQAEIMRLSEEVPFRHPYFWAAFAAIGL